MVAFLLSALGFGKMVLQAIFSWLSKRSLAEIGCIALVITCAVLFISLKVEQRRLNKTEAQLTKCSERQKQLEQQSKVQQREVTKTVNHYLTVTKPVVKREVEKIETAPLPGNCKTPPAVMEADV